MVKSAVLTALLTAAICHATAHTGWAQSDSSPDVRLTGAFCGTAYAGGGPQFSWPLDDAEIHLVSPTDGEVIAIVPTDASGRFDTSNIPQGVYRVALPGFKTTVNRIHVTTAPQRDCRKPLFVLLYLGDHMDWLHSEVVTELPRNFANAATPASEARAAASAEINRALVAGRDLETGEQHFRAAIQIDPTYWLPHVNLALVFLEQGKVTEAEAEFREAVRVGRNNEVPYWQLTTFLVDQGRAADAESALKQARRDRLSSAGVTASFGLLAFLKGEWKEAEARFREVFTFTPEPLFGFQHWEQWNTLLALSVSRQGRHRLVLETWGENPGVLNDVGYGMVERGEALAVAVAMIEKARALAPEVPQILDSLGWANVKLRRFETAESQLGQALRQLPNHPVVLEHLGELYAATGRRDEARGNIEAALQHATDAEQRNRLASRLQQLH